MKHELNDYLKCIPLVDDKSIRLLLDEDKEVWRTYYLKASGNAQKEAEEVAALIEEQKAKLEEFILQSKQRLMEIPEVAMTQDRQQDPLATID